jgi:lysozyme
MPQINAAGLALIKSFEGCELKAYRDIGGVLTIGYGHTGPDVTADLEITQNEADYLLGQDLLRFENGVNALVTHSINPNQFAALVSFAYNVGLGALGESRLLAYVNASNYAAAAGEFHRWVYAGSGEPVAGLVRRRGAEAQLFMTPDTLSNV